MSQTDTIGIIGGGQLAMMLTEAGTKLGLKTIVIDPTPNCPASKAGATQIIAPIDDRDGLKKLRDSSDVITIDVEHVSVAELKLLQDMHATIRPNLETIEMIQDKLRQKQHLRKSGINVADFKEITDRDSAVEALDFFSGKMVLKTRFGAYDGRGNAVIKSISDLDQALNHFKKQKLYAEEFVDFNKELAVMIVRSVDGDTATYPVVETIQKRNICIEVNAPAEVNKSAINDAHELALNVANHLKGAGVFGIEMFLTKNGEVLVNEIAPRVHNSGHYSIEACETSQFENHIRAVSGLKLGSTKMKVKSAVMLNILGEKNAPAKPIGISDAENNPNTKIHLYGKENTKIDRKMGHITVTADKVEVAKTNAKKALSLINI